MEPGTLDKRFVLRLATMVDSGLLSWEFRAAWADDLIARLASPPSWLLDLSTTKYQPDAVRALRAEAYAPPFEEFDSDELSDEFLACLLLRNRRREISWATFLDEGGRHLDNENGRRHCEWLYLMLNDLEHHEYSEEVENTQRASVSAELGEALTRVEPLYLMFLECFRRTVKSAST
jgi:hypothetical protein